MDLVFSLQDFKAAFQSLFIVTLKIPDTKESNAYQKRIKKLSAEKYGYNYDEDDKVVGWVQTFFPAFFLKLKSASETSVKQSTLWFIQVPYAVTGFFDACRLYGLVWLFVPPC